MSIHWAQVFGAAGLGGFRLLPASGHIVTVCDCAACRFSGGREVLAAIEAELGIRAGEETPDGVFSLEVASDVGAGSLSPAIRIDTLVFGPLDADQARHVVQERRKATARSAARARS
jgi:NADH:ubiquinone oxidoreductase subunit E